MTRNDDLIQPSAAALNKVECEYPNRTTAEKYQLAQAEQLMMDFERDRGRRPDSVEELTSWQVAKKIKYLDENK